MPKFIYRAKRGPEDFVNGTIEAENFDRAVERILKQGLTPVDVSIDTQKDSPQKKRTQHFRFSLSNRIGLNEVSVFTRQLCDLIDAGVPILRALQVILNQTQNPHFRKIMDQMYNFVKDGGTFSDALAAHPKTFSPLYVNMVRTGEIGGKLDVVLNRLAEFTEKDLETINKVRSSLVYPAFMLVVGVLTIFVILTFVIPRLTVIFEDLASSLPLPTVILLGLSDFFARFWWLIIIANLGLVAYAKKFTSSREGKLKGDAIKLKLPIVGQFIKDVEIGRFSRTLATLLDSGVVIVSALESVGAVMDNAVLKEEIKNVSGEVASGSSLSEALKECEFFPEAAINMIGIGEESGHLERSLFKLALSYERQSDRAVKMMTSLLEPLMILIVGAVVGFMFVAILLPIFRINLIIQ